MAATEQQKAAIVSLVKEGKFDFKQIAKQVGSFPGHGRVRESPHDDGHLR